jgi:hypothetical protein
LDFSGKKIHDLSALAKDILLICNFWSMHELMRVSGIAAAYRLGADYVKFDDFAEHFFSSYMQFSYEVRYGAEQKRKSEGRIDQEDTLGMAYLGDGRAKKYDTP